MTWTTYSDCESQVEYGIGGLYLVDKGETTKFTDGGSEHRTMFIHRVKLTHLRPSSKYSELTSKKHSLSELLLINVILFLYTLKILYLFVTGYHCGSDVGWSGVYWFRTAPEEESNWSPHLAVYGDMGNENAQSLAKLQQEVQRGLYDAIIHVGDFAYDMDSVSNFSLTCSQI